MREILFCGKRKDIGEWLYGGLTSVNGIPFIHSGNIHNANTDSPFCFLKEVIPETVGQFTGRTSQCTDRIFEHDRCIVTTFDHEGADYQHECVVIWDNGCLVFSNDEIWIPVAEIVDTDTDVKIIGNIHDDELSENSHD